MLCLFCVALPSLSQAALPAAVAVADVKTKVIVEVADTFNGRYGYAKHTSDSDKDTTYVAGSALLVTSSASATGTRWPSGSATSASGSATAAATAGWGSLHAAAWGNGSAPDGNSDTESRAYASFVDYVSFSSTTIEPISVYFGYGISSSVTASPSDAYAAVSGSGSVYDYTAKKILWTSTSYSSHAPGTVSDLMYESVDLTLDPTHVYELRGSLIAAGRANFSSTSVSSASFAADASHTGEMWLDIRSPGVSYIASSGAIYLTAPTWAAPVPEPESYAMLLAGLGIMGAVARRRK